MVTTDEYLAWDAVEMAGLVRSGTVSAAELDEACRARIEQVNPTMNAVADLAPPGRRAASEEGPLAGVPFAVKELLAIPGLPWTMGSRLLATNEAGPASPYVQRLLAAGLHVVCSTTSSELGLLGSTESALRGVTVNPWGPGLSAGGSSGGSAVAVAAGIVPMAHANDAGGSIRGPASLVGLFGFLPSVGRCERTGPDAGGLTALVVDHCISLTVRDSAALLAVTERRGPHARYEPIGLVDEPTRSPLRIAVLATTLHGHQPEPAVGRALDRTVELCVELGHRIVEVDVPAIDAEALSHAFFATAARTVAGLVDAVTPLLGRRPGPDELEPFTLELADWAATLPPDTEHAAAAAIVASAAAYRTQFERCDVVLSPTFPRPPWPLGTLHPSLGREELVRRTEQLVGYTPIHNLAGCPAMSVPLEWHDGLPIGMHLAASPGADATLLGLAYQLEAARPWAPRHADRWAEDAPWPRS